MRGLNYKVASRHPLVVELSCAYNVPQLLDGPQIIKEWLVNILHHKLIDHLVFEVVVNFFALKIRE